MTKNYQVIITEHIKRTYPIFVDAESKDDVMSQLLKGCGDVCYKTSHLEESITDIHIDIIDSL